MSKVLLWVGIAFVVILLIKNPEGAAAAIGALGHSVSTFVSAL